MNFNVTACEGFGLFEVVLAIFILSFGILSVASLQLAALKRTEDSYYQTVAINQVNNLLEQFCC